MLCSLMLCVVSCLYIAKYNSILLLYYCTAFLEIRTQGSNPPIPDPPISFIPQNIPRKPPVPSPTRLLLAWRCPLPTQPNLNIKISTHTSSKANIFIRQTSSS